MWFCRRHSAPQDRKARHPRHGSRSSQARNFCDISFREVRRQSWLSLERNNRYGITFSAEWRGGKRDGRIRLVSQANENSGARIKNMGTAPGPAPDQLEQIKWFVQEILQVLREIHAVLFLSTRLSGLLLRRVLLVHIHFRE